MARPSLAVALWTVLLARVAGDVAESFNTTPPPVASGFTCSGRQMGFYADVGTNCRAYHTCDDHGNHFTHYCPEDTAFRQDAMVCDHAYLVNCQASIDKAPRLSRIDLDDSHDAPPSSFVEPRGEGSNAKGYARSFRINPDSKKSAYPTFVLNSSVFLKNRDSAADGGGGGGGGASGETRSKESHEDFSRTDDQRKVVFPSHKEESPAPFRFRESSTRNSISTTSRSTLSENLQPPTESSRTSRVFVHNDDDFSFLVPPDVRDDNVDYTKDTFQSLKTSSTQSHLQPFNSFKTSSTQSHLRPFNSFKTSSTQSHPQPFNSFHTASSPSDREPFDFFKIADSNESFERIKDMAPVTFSPRTEMMLQMVKARGLARDSGSSFLASKPANFLEPPVFKSESTPFARSNFNFHNDYPYVETLRSIQNNNNNNNNKPSTAPFISRPSPTTPSPKFAATEASILPVPTKALVPVSDVELDPYYPKAPTTTEAYYTPRQQAGGQSRKPYYATTRKPAGSGARFEIPAVLPDLNSLEDLLDRRKFFFIPRLKGV